MKPLISVVIPIYGVEKYLKRAVDSVLHQTYTNLDIILVDDGSKDGCPAICDAYAAREARVRVIHKENGAYRMPEMQELQSPEVIISHFWTVMITMPRVLLKYYIGSFSGQMRMWQSAATKQQRN